MIEVKNITKKYDKTVLDNVSLEVPDGKRVSLIGPSGCGKSTLLRIIMGLTHAESGEIFIDGNKMDVKNVRQLRRSIGYVIQNGGLFPHLTARENCTLVTSYLGWGQKRENQRILELAELTSIDPTILERKPDNLSGGQAQRISLIRALMLDPPFILLDEPLGSIDPLVRYDLQNDLKQIFESLQKTVLLVTHDLSEAAFLGDTIVLMKDGKIVQKGSIQQIISQPEDEFVEKFVSARRTLPES